MYYLPVLFVLIWLYGFHETNTILFSYNEFYGRNVMKLLGGNWKVAAEILIKSPFFGEM
ncbi:teichoic acid D-Ala incorporation-associated protein DltX [Bacillus cereus]|uniref:teichoic acid D-Ala incorporation-associated protein DltX n=1 Tax=Bacillus cereus TaxID=1396 RepID=UPI003CD0D268